MPQCKDGDGLTDSDSHFPSLPCLVGIPSRTPQACKPKLFSPCLQKGASMAAKCSAAAPIHRAKKKSKDRKASLLARQCQAPVKHCAAVGWSLDSWANSSPSPHIPPSKKNKWLPDKPCVLPSLLLWLLGLVTGQETPDSSPHCPCSHRSVWLLASPLPLLALAPAPDPRLAWQLPAAAQHFLNPVSHSLFSPSPPPPRSGATGASPVGTSECDSATGRTMASDSPLQLKAEEQGELCCPLLCCTTLSSFFINLGVWT